MQREEAMRIFDLVVKQKLLPEKLSELVPLSFIGQAAVTYYREKVKLMDQLKMTEKQRKETLQDGQNAGEMLLEIESQIGRLAAKEPKTIPNREVTNGKFSQPSGKPPKHQRLGIPTPKKMREAQLISKHPKIVKSVIKQAKEREDIPTKGTVLATIKYEKEKKRRKEAEGKQKEIRIVIDIEQTQYLNALDRILRILPQKPPKTWNDEALKEATAKAKIIIKRLEVFNVRE